jgi:hypothetical protein
MRRIGRLGFVHIACVTIAALLLTRGAVFAQDVTEPALKAAFIYNFAKFTEWPADAVPASKPFVVCVLGDAAVGDALQQTLNPHVLGHIMTVSIITPAGPWGLCHIVYVSGFPAAQVARLVAGLRDSPVLTISDIDRFAELGGIAQLFFEHGQLRFSINDEFARRAHLQISSKLLALAKTK